MKLEKKVMSDVSPKQSLGFFHRESTEDEYQD